MPRSLRSALVVTLFVALVTAYSIAQTVPGSGGLIVGDRALPLKHTRVEVGISGFLARVNVTQEFLNDSPQKIEAVYVFPLPNDAAVDDMTITVGAQTIRGQIKQRDVARKIYNAARARGQVAALLDQERPNIFTQSVANIEPGAAVTVTISYVEVLRYDAGAYEFVFPTVVGQRYLPASMIANPQSGAPAARINPERSLRSGHDISIAVALDAGVPVMDLTSPTHAIDADRTGASSAIVRLKNSAEISNRDFILRYQVAGEQIQDAVLTHRTASGAGFFLLILQPPERFPEWDVNPKELVFVLDTSGSMSGFPIEKAKEAMQHALEGLYAQDTFNLITFAGDTHVLFPEPVPATPENLRLAKQFLSSREGGGGTEMMKAIRTALAPSPALLASAIPGGADAVGVKPVRIVCFMTDGYVGNDMEIVGEIQKNPHARVFAFGIGSSVNRFLLDNMARAGRGEVEYVGLEDDGSAAALRFHERIRAPLLTDIEVDFGGLAVADVFPARTPDLFAAKPVVLFGRYTKPDSGTVILRAQRAGAPWTHQVQVNLPESQSAHDSIAKLWARTRVDALMSRDWSGVQERKLDKKLEQEITDLGLRYRLMTQFTSFVAVAEEIVTIGGEPMLVTVLAEVPHGTRPEQQGINNRALSSVVTSKINTNSTVNYVTKSGSSTTVPAGEEVVSMSAAETVEVEGTAPMIESSSSQVSTTFGPNFPTIGNTPGVWNTGGHANSYSGGAAVQALRTPPPGYPEAVRRSNPAGTVVLKAKVLNDGTVTDISVKKSVSAELDRRSVEALRVWRFLPVMLGSAKLPLEVKFTFDDSGVKIAPNYSGERIRIANAENPIGLLALEPHQRLAMEDKLDPDLLAQLVCVMAARKACGATADSALQIHVRLNDTASIETLRAAGFAERFQMSSGVVGSVALSRLAALALLDAVAAISPPPSVQPLASR
jgi:Ca-activated chloride channel homolog